MIRFTLAAALALIASPPSAAQAPQTRTFVSADGAYWIVHEERQLEGSALPDGRWRRFVAPKDGSLADDAVPVAEGRWSQGRLEGLWTWRFDDGAMALVGHYVAGRRSGPWLVHDPAGTPLGGGSHAHGLQHGFWILKNSADPEGNPGAQLYGLEHVHWPTPGAPRLRAQRRGGARSGPVHGFWRDGRSPLVLGQYQADLPHARWDFYLVDGRPETEFVSGWYEQGRRLPPGERTRDAHSWLGMFEEFQQLELELRRARRSELPAPGPAPIPALARRESEERAQALESYLAGDDEPLPLLVAAGRALCREGLEQLIALDLADAGAVRRGARWVELLEAICAGRGFGWERSTEETARAANNLARARWSTWWELVREDDDWWRRLAAGALEGDGLLTLELVAPRAAIPPAEPAPPLARIARTPAPKLAGSGDPRAQEGLRWAQGWLLAHQQIDGSWEPTGFGERCSAARGEPCAGPGIDDHAVGVTALALLALMADGRSVEHPEIAAAVRRGLDWLASQQVSLRMKADLGLFGVPKRTEFLYDQALATLALSQGWLHLGASELADPIQRAVALLEAARNPFGAWRYALPPAGENDTSVTGWMVAALLAAERSGARVDPGLIEGAASWIDEVTDLATGRIGYDARGGASSRVPRVNTQFPTDRTEAMTAMGMATRLLLGQSPGTDRALPTHAQLLLRALPVWDEKLLSVDVYYWYHGTRALHLYRAYDTKPWKPWTEALKKALLGSQRKDGHAQGSWDPIGPWGFAGGRVYSTALGALSLALLLEPAPRARR